MILKDSFFSKKSTYNFGGTLFELTSPIAMGIINLTPDSFYEASRYASENEILDRCDQILSEGGSIIDIGAYSSRPGAENITEDEEINRLAPALSAIRKKFPDAIISVDTFRASVASYVTNNFGIQIINDISGGELDENMLETISSLKVSYIIMHMKGTPQNMQQNTEYSNFIRDIIGYFAQKLALTRKYGIKDVIMDPGFGFGKTTTQNYQLLKALNEFRILELPILVGISRKSMVYKTLETTPNESLAGTIAAQTLALQNGAQILRVHDVKQAVDTIKIVNAYKNS